MISASSGGGAAGAADNVVYGVPFGQPRACRTSLDSVADRGDRREAEVELIFTTLVDALRRARVEKLEVDARGVHTWHLRGVRPVTVSIVRGRGEHFDVVVDSPEFERSLVVRDFERRRTLLSNLAVRAINGRAPRVAAEPRHWREVDGIVL